MPTHQIGDHRIDELSQRILSVLLDLSESETPRIVDELDAKPQSVHYRLKTHLRPAGLVQRLGQSVDATDSADASRPPVAWSITAAGEEFVESRDIAEAASKQAAIESVERLRGRVEEFSERLSAADDRLNKWQETMDKRAKKLEDIKGDAEDAVSDADEATSTASSNSSDINDLRSEFKELKADLKELEGRVDGLERKQENHAEKTAESFRKMDEKVDEIGRKARKANNRGFLDILRG